MTGKICMRLLVLVLAAIVLQACTSSMSGEDLLENRLRSTGQNSTPANAKQAKLNRFLAADANQGQSVPFEGISKQGNDQLVG